MSLRAFKLIRSSLSVSSFGELFSHKKHLYASIHSVCSNRNFHSKYYFTKPHHSLEIEGNHLPLLNSSLINHSRVNFSTSISLKNKEQSPGVLQRFKNAYKEYGKLLVAVHCATSVVWISCFYYVAISGLDIVPLMEKIGAGQTAMKVLDKGGNLAVSYLLYKLATPVRYTVTIGGTQLTAHYLYKYNYMKSIPEQDSLGALFKEGSGQAIDKIDDLTKGLTGNIKNAKTAARLTYVKSVKSAKNSRHLGHIKSKFNHLGKIRKR